MDTSFILMILALGWISMEIVKIFAVKSNNTSPDEKPEVKAEKSESLKWYDPFDNKILEDEPVKVRVYMPNKLVVLIGVSKENLEKVIKLGLPLGSLSFKFGRVYYVDVDGVDTTQSLKGYDPDKWSMWEIPWFKKVFSDYDDYQSKNELEFKKASENGKE